MNIELCCAEEVAGVLGIEVDTLYRYARKGRIRGMKVGKAWRFLPADVQKFLDQNAYFVKSPQAVPHREIEPSVLPDVLRQAAVASDAPRIMGGGFAPASYGGLDRDSTMLADHLLGRGLVPGDRVLILLPNCVEFIAACFAVWKAGAIVVAEDPAIADDDLRHIIMDCAVEGLIVDRSVAERLEVRRHRLENIRAMYVKDNATGLPGLAGLSVESLEAVLESETAPNGLRFSGSSSDDTATITYPRAGGRVGAGVMNTHGNWLAAARFTRQFHRVTQDDAAVFLLPLGHSQALRQTVACIMADAAIVLDADLDQAAQAAKNGGSLALVLRSEDVKAIVEQSASAWQKMAGAVRYVEIAVAPMEEATFERLGQLLPAAIIRLAWNLTEAHAAFLDVGPSGQAESIGLMPPGLKLTVIDQHRRELPPGQPGLMHLRGPGLMQGFWGQSADQRTALRAEGACPGGQATRAAHGGILFMGQTKESLDIRGRKVNPSELEVLLGRHIRVAECAVLGMLEPDGQVGLHAFVVPTAKGAMLTESELKAYCRTFMETSKLPARIHFFASLPKGSDGQILREELRALPALAVKRGPRRSRSAAAGLVAQPA